jgi:uncharacterized membrane-anchored protein
MQQIHVPLAGARYWTALSIASVFGANSGDFVAEYLHLGHVWGLLPLTAILAVILLAERRESSVHQAYYWLAIIVIRTAATNLADFGASDLGLKKIWLIAVLTVVLAMTLFLSPPSKSSEPTNTRPFRVPTTDAKYWTAMLIAGTLGTVIGDLMSFDSGMGTAYASLIQGGVLAILFVLGGLGLFANIWFYWLTVVVVRAAGTSVSDFIAHIVGLPLSTLGTGLLFVGTLLIWSEQRHSR